MENKATRQLLTRVFEPPQWAKSRIRCEGCGERLYYSEIVAEHLDSLVMYGETFRTLLVAHHVASNHYAGTARELEENNSPIPSV